MARRCGINKPCPSPRASWWKSFMGIDYYNGGGGLQPSEILFGSDTVLWGSTTVTFND